MAAAVIALSAVAVACSSGRADAPSSARRVRPDGDLTVRRGRFEDRFLISGQLAAVRSENLVVPPIPSWQTTIRWMEAEGTVVKAGQKLVEFDTSSFAQEYSEKLLARDQAVSDLDQAEADRAGVAADKEFQVAQKTIAVERARIAAAIPADYIRGREYQDHQMALKRAENDLDKAREDLAAHEASSEETIRQKRIALDRSQRELDTAQLAMDGMVLTAPRNGILVVADHPWERRKLQVGDSVWRGLSVVGLPDLAAMRVDAKLSDVDDGRIAPVLPVVCILDAYPDRTYTGRISEITPVAQEEAGRSLRRAYNVHIELDAAEPDRMRPGMSVKVEVRPPARENVLLAPRSGIDFTGAVPRARLASGREIDVKLGPCNLDSCVVEGGVEDGARLRSER